MKKVTCLAIGTIMLGSVSLAQADIINIVNNGDFENGLSDWSLINGNTFNLAEIDIDGTGSLTTSHAGHTTSVGSLSAYGVFQDVNLTAGIEYSFDVDLMSTCGYLANADAGSFSAVISGQSIGSYEFGYIGSNQSLYGEITTSFTVDTTGSYALYLSVTRSYGPTNNVSQYFDNISLTYDDGNSTGAAPVPEPATILLFGTGLVGLIGSTRRKRRKH